MSDPIGASVKFAAPFSLDNVTKLIECVRAAVLENWEKYADQYSNPTPNLKELDLPAAATHVVEEIETGKDEYESGSRASSTEDFSYSPLTFWAPYLTFWRDSDGTMRVCMTILSSSPPYERQGNRERLRMEWQWEEECRKRGKPWQEILRDLGPQDGELDEEAYDAWWDKYHSLGEDYSPSVWPQNRQCFLNIIEHFKSALPVKEVRLDAPFMEASDTT